VILIDSLYINNSGGLRLLKYLVETLNTRRIDFYLLADSRCLGKFDSCKNVKYMKASLIMRHNFYMAEAIKFTSVLCFGNLPAPIKLSIPVYTYFHNINLLTLTEAHGLKEKTLSWMKRQVFRHYKHNTDLWLVQTQNTAYELIKHLKENKKRVKLLPFFELNDDLKNLKNKTHGNDYTYIANYTGAKGHEELLEAWRILHKRGIDRFLHLTVDKTNIAFCNMINQAQLEGVRIVNHGIIPFKEVIKIYLKSKAEVYPSHNESLGLGIIEAISAGCDVICADLPYTHAICTPSVLFSPINAISIANAIEKYERYNYEKSELLVVDKIDDLISLLKD